MKRLLVAMLSVTIAVVLSGCGSQDPIQKEQQSSGLVVGSADFSESELLMHVYAGALRSTGAKVETKPRIGAREVYVEAVRKGELAMVPDYSGNLLNHIDESTVGKVTERQAVYDQLKQKLPRELGVLEMSSAEDKDVLTVTKRTADQGVRSMADLGPRCPQMILGAPAEWKTRWEAKIADVYGCKFKDIRSLEAGTVTAEALSSNQVQVANLFTTSSLIQTNNFVKLDDPKNMYPAQNVVPLVNNSKVGDAQRAALNKVSAALTTEKLTDMNKRIEVDKDNSADVAKAFLAELGM